MNVNLILPPQPFLGVPERNAPLGIMYLAAVIRESGHDVIITDLRKNDLTPITEADIFGFSATTPEYNSCVEIAIQLKAKYPKSYLVIGGIHPTVCDVNSIFDFICEGEGELAILDIIKSVERKDFFRRRIRTKAPNINLLPLPARDLLPSFIATDFVEKGKRATSIIASRGCAFNCPFCCSRAFWGQHIRYRDIDLIINEIKYLKNEHGIEQLRFHDDGFTTASTKYITALCNAIQPLGIQYRINARIDCVTPEILEKLYQSGCIDIGYGVESVEQNVLDRCNKRTKVKQIYRVLMETRAAGIKTRIFLITGLPGQTKNSHKRTIEFIENTKPDTVDISTLVPYPGSDYYSQPEKYGIRLKETSFDNYIKQLGFYQDELEKDFVFEHDILSEAQLKKTRAKLHAYIKKYKMDNAK